MINKGRLLVIILFYCTIQLSAIEQTVPEKHKRSLLRAISVKIDPSSLRRVTRTYSEEETNALLKQRFDSQEMAAEAIESPPRSSTTIERDVTQWSTATPARERDQTPGCCDYIKSLGKRITRFLKINKNL